MSPIDIVPIEHMLYDDPYMMETSLNRNGVIVNQSAIAMSSDGISRDESLSSVKPLVGKIPPRGTGRVVSKSDNIGLVFTVN